MKLRFETAPILLLRGVLERSNPEHAKLLEDVHQVLMSEEEKGSSVKKSKRSIVKASLFPPPSPDCQLMFHAGPCFSFWESLRWLRMHLDKQKNSSDFQKVTTPEG
jgi:hypothetical protein